MKKVTVLTAIVVAIVFSGCAPKYTDEQRQEMESRIIDADREVVFHSLVSILQDKGYVIDHSDFAGGVIKANSGTNTSWFIATTVSKHEVTATVSPYGAGRTKVRVTFRRIAATTYEGSTSVKTVITTEPEQMTAFFGALEKEVFMRKNLNR